MLEIIGSLKVDAGRALLSDDIASSVAGLHCPLGRYGSGMPASGRPVNTVG